VLVGVGLFALAGCDLGPSFSKPEAEIPTAFRASPATAQAAWPAPDWWRGFGSSELDDLIAAARTANPDLAVAAARVRQADAQSRIAGAPLLPDVQLLAARQRSRLDAGRLRHEYRRRF
jgi:outer membrane protein, multidrug efflux system